MYRPLIIVVGFVIVTLGLIFFQPSRDRSSTEFAQAPVAAEQPVVETTVAPETASELAVAQAVRPIARPELATGVEVTRAPSPVLQLAPAAVAAPVAAQTGEKAFANIAAERPNLLTASVRGANGQLELGSSTTQTPTALVTPAPAPAPAIIPIEPVAVAPTPVEPAPVIDELAQLRLQLATVPTKAVHTVRLGDSLHTLALRYYGDAEKSKFILEANRRLIRDERVLTIGQILRIPEISNL